MALHGLGAGPGPVLAGHLEVIADEDTAQTKAALSADPAIMYAAQLAAASGR